MKSRLVITLCILSWLGLAACSKNSNPGAGYEKRAPGRARSAPVSQDESAGANAQNSTPTADPANLKTSQHEIRGASVPFAGDDRDVTEIPHGIKIMINDAGKMNMLLRAEWNKTYIQFGNVIDASAVDRSAGFCFMKLGDSTPVKAGQIISIPQPVVDGRILIDFEDATGLQFACNRKFDAATWTVQQLKEAFGKAASVLVSE